MGFQRVLQVDLKMESFPEPLGSRWMAWQVEYPASRAATQEVETEIRLAQEDLAGIVPLAMVIHATSSSVPHPQRQLHTPHTECDIVHLVYVIHILFILNPDSLNQHLQLFPFSTWMKWLRIAALLIMTVGSLMEKIPIHGHMFRFSVKHLVTKIYFPKHLNSKEEAFTSCG